MRIHSLTLEAFGPFPGRESIDFDALDHGILLVNGPTGSGKSSLLDAVTFALFGDVAGARRTLRNSLRSHHAPLEREPSVELTFSVGTARWRIRRVPQWEAPKRRGSGTTTRHASVQLSQWRNEDGVGAWHIVSTRIDEAAETISDVLGMGLDQFAQVVLLPQGDFAEFLRARPEDRRVLLERLFDVGRFDGVERWLAEAKQQRSKARDTSLAEIAAHLAVVADVVDRLDDPTFEGPQWSAETVDTLPQQLRELLTRLRAQRDATHASAEADASRAQAAERASERATTVLEAHQAYARARQEQERWSAHEIDGLNSRIQAATAVASILTMSRRVESAAKEFAQSEGQRTSHRKALQELTASSFSDETDLEKRFPPGDLTARTAALHKAHRHLDLVIENATRLADARDEVASAQQKAEQVEEEFGACAQHVAAMEKELDAAREGLTRCPDVTHELSSLSGIRTKHERATRLARDTQSARERNSEAFAKFRTAESHVIELRSARLAGMAAELATDLVPGIPCPVCGATEHPAPTPRAPDAPESHDIERAEAEARKADGARLEAQTTLASLESGLDALLTEIDSQLAALTSYGSDEAPEPWPTIPPAERLVEDGAPLEALRLRYEALQETHRGATDNVTQLRARQETAQERYAQLSNRRASAKAGLEAATTQHHRAETALSESHTVAIGLLDACDVADLALPPAVEQASDRPAIETYRSATQECLARLIAAQEQHTQVVDALHRVQLIEETYRLAERRLHAERESLTDELTAKGYEDLDAARRVALDEDTLAELRATWQHAVEARAAAEVIVDDPRYLSAAYAPAPDESSLRQRAEMLSRQAGRSRTVAARWANAYATLTALRDTVADAVRQHVPLADAAREVADLSNTFSGTGENTHRMRLTSYVLAAHLETVTAMANERLHHMTDGRYQLKYTDDRAKGTQRSGLGLLVVDAWTGRARETSTLSGGEAFMASLALALGLGDAVRADSGGMELHTLFVDEGFGSLDQDTLEHVMEVLDGLREGGRLVGVVSHVTELRARIPTRIDIRKSAEGSTVHTDSPQISVSDPQ